MMSDNTTTSRYPFTPSQWQELEHQALIFKYMASGHPIPSDLILSIRRSLLFNPSPTTLFPLHPNIGWGCYQVGYGRKVEDPEPGRCRRTDGKKWRCSKEAHPDSKYCERHMHRGKNRSRKPVETNTNTTITNTNTNNNNHHHKSLPYGLSQQNHHLSMPTSDPHATFYPYSRNQAINFRLESGGSSATTDKDFRFFHGLREEVDQYERDNSWRFTPLGMSSLGESKQRPIPQPDYYINPTPKDLSKDCENEEEKHKNQQPHCFVLGADLQRSVRDQEDEESQRPLRRFFDEWPKTQLSISTPMSYHDFSISQSHTG